MKLKGLIILFCAALFSASVQAQDSRFNLLLKSGTYTMSDTNQDHFGVPVFFDEDSSGIFGVDFMFLNLAGMKMGVEIYQFENDFFESGGFGTASTMMTFFNVRKYFLDGMIQPYVGAGAGFGFSNFDSSGFRLSGSAFGINAQFLLGLELQFVDNFGIFLEYKNVILADYEGETIFGDVEDFDFSGSGISAGVAFHF